MGRILSAAEVKSLGLDDEGPASNPKTGRVLSDDEVAALGLDKPEPPKMGPYRDNPAFSATPQRPAPPPGLTPEPPAAPRPLSAEPLGARPPTTTQGQAFGAHVLGGASLGFDDEAAGLVNAIGKRIPMTDNAEFGGVPGTLPEAQAQAAAAPKKSFGDDYREGRDDLRRVKSETARDWPKTSIAAEVGGSLLTGGGAAKTAVGRIAQAAATGAAAGAGNSSADLTEGEVVPLLKDTGVGLGVGAAIGAGGEALKKGVSYVANKVTSGLKRRILNEVAEGTANTTPTGRKRLNKAGEAIFEEVTAGPDASAVRKSYLGGDAQQGIDKLEPIVDKVSARNARNYARFEKAGKDAVDVGSYGLRLEQAAVDAQKAGQSRLAAGIRKFKNHVAEQAADTGGLKLTQLRGLTTEAQGIASSVLGSLNEHANAKVARQVEGAVTEAMSDTLHDLAKGNRSLVRAANDIEGNNTRLQALLTVKDSLARRADKESSAKSFLVRNAEKVAAPAAAGAAMGAFGSEDKFTGALEGAATGAALRYGIPAAARAIDRTATTAAIRSLRPGGIPLNAAERLAQTLGRVGAGAYVRSKQDEQP